MIHNRAMGVAYVNAQGMAGGVVVPGRYFHDDGMVEFMAFAPFKLYAQEAVCLRIPGKDHQTAGDFIQTMDNPETTKILLQVCNQRG